MLGITMKKLSYPVTLFYSYAPEDEKLQRRLEKHLGLLRQQGIITEWHRRRLEPGVNWIEAVDYRINVASVILLLISSDYLASEYCYGTEMLRALRRYEDEEVDVIPILLRPVDWQMSPFTHLQCLP